MRPFLTFDRLLLTAALAALWIPVVQLLGAQWTIYEQYHYGWAVPFLCLYLAYRRSVGAKLSVGRHQLSVVSCPLLDVGDQSRSCRAEPGFPASNQEVIASNQITRPFLLCVFFMTALLLTPTRILQEANPLWRLASYLLAGEAVVLTLLLVGNASWLMITGCSLMGIQYPAKNQCRSTHNRAFPVVFFLVAVPWPTPVESLIVQDLARFNTNGVMELLSSLGIPAVTHGNVIEVSGGMVGIDEACSGIRSIQATFMIALFLGEFYRLRVNRRIGLVLAGFALAMLLNLVRTFNLVLIADGAGLQAMRRWHDLTGAVLLLGCFAGTLGVAARSRERGPRRGIAVNGYQSKEGQADPANLPPPTPDPEPEISDVRPPLSLLHAHSSVLPAPFSCLLPALVLLALSLASVLASELWFRAHERRHETARAWTAVAPTHAKLLPISDHVRRQLLYDQGVSASWRRTEGVQWRMVYFRWNPAKGLKDCVRVQLAKSHRPEICLPASGQPLRRELDPIVVNLSGLALPFRFYEFRSADQPVYVFYCVREDATPDAQFGNMRETHAARWAAAWNGNRGVGQRVLELALWGVPDGVRAQECFRREIAGIVR